MKSAVLIILVLVVISCNTNDTKSSTVLSNRFQINDSITNQVPVDTVFINAVQEKSVGDIKSKKQVFTPNKVFKSSMYSLLKLVYIYDRNVCFLEFADTTSILDSHGNYEITFQVYPGHLSINENKLKFYGHSGELGEVQANLTLNKNSKNVIVKMKGEISFLNSSFKEVVFERRTTAQ